MAQGLPLPGGGRIRSQHRGDDSNGVALLQCSVQRWLVGMRRRWSVNTWSVDTWLVNTWSVSTWFVNTWFVDARW
jgi:hypothetical protein